MRHDTTNRSLSQDGFVTLENAIPLDEVNRALAAIWRFVEKNDSVFSSENDFSSLNRVSNLHLLIPELATLLSCSQEATFVMSSFFGESPTVYTSLYFRHGTRQPLHVDSPYFTTVPYGRYLGCWIALEDSTLENGCLHVVPGGHLTPLIEPTAFLRRIGRSPDEIGPVDQMLWDQYQLALSETWSDKTAVAVEVPKGSIVIWHPSLPHGGGQVTKLPVPTRQSIVFHVTPFQQSVYQLDGFFGAHRGSLIERGNFEYCSLEGLLCRRHTHIGLAHQSSMPIGDFHGDFLTRWD